MIHNYFIIALRNLKKNFSFAFLNITGLALGMACTILIFALVRYHLSFDNFHPDPSRIYRLVTDQHRDQISYVGSVPNPLGKALRTDYSFGEQIARIATFEQQLMTVSKVDQSLRFKEEVAFAEPEFFEIFNYPLYSGNKPTVLTELNTAIITRDFAKKYFGDQEPIGKVFKLENKIDFTITGILENLPANTDRRTGIYLSYNSLKAFNTWFGSDDSWGGISSSMQTFIKLKTGIDPGEVEKVMPAFVKKFRPTAKNVHHYKLQPLGSMHFDAKYGGVMDKRNLWVLTFIGLFLVVTACVNFINLATAQALKRAREIGVRKALGSMRFDLFWQFMSETALITLLGLGLAQLLVFGALPYVNSWFQSRLMISGIIDINYVSFCLMMFLVVSFFSGSYPAFVLAGFQPVLALKNKISQSHIGGFNTRRALIITQLAISQLLIIGMIVIVKQMKYVKESDLGFSKEGIAMLPVGIAESAEKRKTLKNTLMNVPGVSKVSLCYAAPASQENWSSGINYDNRIEAETFRVNVKAADDQYLETFDLELVAGRNLFPSDSAKEFLVNESLTKKLNLINPEEIIGDKVSFNGNISGVVVGVVRDFHDKSFHEDITALLIASYTDNYFSYAVRFKSQNLAATLKVMEARWNETFPDQVYSYELLDDQLAQFYTTESLMLKVIRLFSGLAIFIGCLGLYGLISFMAARKSKEIGIRKVLGSSITGLLWLFGKEFLVLTLTAFAVSAPLAWWLMSIWLRDFKFRIDLGPGVFIFSVLVTLAIVFATIGFRAVKAATLNPIKNIRIE